MIYKNKKTNTAFTIVELLVVIVVIGILATLGIVAYNGIQADARDKALLSDIEAVEGELARYASKNGGVYGAALNWDSSTGQNTSIDFTPSPGNVLVVQVAGTTYCIKAYNPASSSRSIDTAVRAGACGWSLIAVGAGGCGIALNGAYCWGSGTSGQLGNGSTANSSVPVAVTTSGALAGKTVKSISVSRGTSGLVCAVASGGAYCWGSGTSGQLGNGSTANSSVPVAVTTSGALAGKTVKSISAGKSHACAIASDDNVYCWGFGGSGQLGNGSTANSSVPVAVTTSGALAGKTVKSISAGDAFTCAIASDDNAYCWGYGTSGQLGNGSTANSSMPVAVTTSGALAGKTVKSISAGNASTCAIASDDNAYCWGYGPLGSSAASAPITPSPVAVATSGVLSGKSVKVVTVGSNHACAIASDDNAYCWGVNSGGQLGTGSNSGKAEPAAVTTSGTLAGKTVKSISAGEIFTCAIASDDNAYCWGYGPLGQLGNGTTATVNAPVLVTFPSAS